MEVSRGIGGELLLMEEGGRGRGAFSALVSFSPFHVKWPSPLTPFLSPQSQL